MNHRPSIASVRREIRLLERSLVNWPTSPRLKRRLAEEQARLVRLKSARAREIYRKLLEAEEETVAQLAQLLGVA